MDQDSRDLGTRSLREVRSGREPEDLPGVLKQEASGTGTVVLFAGPTGTGKTMAAETLAKGLGMGLFRRVFSDAETAGAVLFFDEADALFARQGDVKDSHDRYANLEVGYLLQRLETLHGIVLLSVNHPEAARAVAGRVRAARTIVVW
jgi:SpoVK/Ycf46/Vps4 family AAA+-type ATPase